MNLSSFLLALGCAPGLGPLPLLAPARRDDGATTDADTDAQRRAADKRARRAARRLALASGGAP